MRRANAQLQIDRRAEILAAAERCFVRSGFHQTSMQEICSEAGMSPGNLYRYYESKVAIIAGIAERDRAEVLTQLANAPFSSDFFGTMAALARHHVVERTAEEVGLCAETMAESRRNPEVARIFQGFDADVEAAARGDIRSDIDFESVVTMMMAMVDGVWWRRAVDPAFDAEAVLPIFLDNVRHMLLDRPERAFAGGGES
jgi:TetR/AcrR family transcriptional repressor of uid operon